MVATRTDKGGRLQGLPSVRHIRDPSPEPDEATEQQGASTAKGTKQRGAAASSKNPSKPKPTKAGNAAKNAATVLSDRRCARSALLPSWNIPALLSPSSDSHPPLFVSFRCCSQAPGTLVEGVPHTFWVVAGEDGTGCLPVDARVVAKVRTAARRCGCRRRPIIRR